MTVASLSRARARTAAAVTVGLLTLCPVGPATASVPLPEVDTARLTHPARVALQAAEQVTVSTDVEWTFDVPTILVTPAPPVPAPAPPAPVVEEMPAPAAVVAAPAVVAVPVTDPQPTPAADTPPPAAAGNTVLDIAASLVGVPYVAGGTTPAGFDCSGFTSYVYAQLGVTLPRSSSDQRNAGTVVPRDQAQPGDLIWSPGHVGIYAGDNTQIDSPRPGKTIAFRPIWQSDPLFIRITS